MVDQPEDFFEKPALEVPEEPARRWFDAACKLQILHEAKRCFEAGQLGGAAAAGRNFRVPFESSEEDARRRGTVGIESTAASP